MSSARIVIRLLASVVFIAVAGRAFAQQSTAATYGDWVVRCTMQGTPAKKACDMEQTTEAQGKNTPVSRVAIAQPMKAPPINLIVQLPVNVWMASGVRIEMNDKDPGYSGHFVYCAPAGCFAEVEVTADTLKKFRTTTAPGRIVFKNAGQRDVAIPISFKGFGDAYDALVKG
jgi:invasion protein IalB